MSYTQDMCIKCLCLKVEGRGIIIIHEQHMFLFHESYDLGHKLKGHSPGLSKSFYVAG